MNRGLVALVPIVAIHAPLCAGENGLQRANRHLQGAPNATRRTGNHWNASAIRGPSRRSRNIKDDSHGTGLENLVFKTRRRISFKAHTRQAEQPQNAWYPMLVTRLPIVMLLMLVQLQNAPTPMLVTLLGIVTLVRLAHPRTPAPMLVTLLGMVRLARLVQI